MSLLQAPDSADQRCATASIQRILDVLGDYLPKSKSARPASEQPTYNSSFTLPIAHNQSSPSGFPARWKQSEQERGTILYLGYGSNLCHEVFQERRGVKPLAYANVVVPTLRLTFDLPGLPYSEPCFANTARRDPSKPNGGSVASEKSSLLNDPDYHKDRWTKGLVGVVYECTPEDYAHIIATEGGGASYHDILVDCFVIPKGAQTVPMHPKSEPFVAHTLFAPATPDSDDETHNDGRLHRPDASYAQASARYLKFFLDGGEEHGFPEDYKEYLRGLRPYTITTKKQRAGQAFLLATWLPLLGIVFALQKMFQDEKGKNPAWLNKLSSALFLLLWATYDGVMIKVFGDGERTIGDNDEVPAKICGWRRALPPSLRTFKTRTDDEIGEK